MEEEYFETRNEALNSLLGGGILRGEGLLVKQGTEKMADQLFVSAIVDVLDNLVSGVLLPRRSLSYAELDEQLDRLNVSVDALLDNDQLFVLDTDGRWDDHTNVFGVSDGDDIKEATRTALERSRARGTVHMLDVNAIVATVGEEDARALREWYRSDAFRGKRDYLIETALLPDLSADLLAFYENADRQVVSLERTGSDDRLTIEAAPEGAVGEARTIEYLDGPPFVRLS